MGDMYKEIPKYIWTIMITLYIVIIIVGVIGNVLVAIVILKNKRMRNSTNIFLVNLAIADLIYLIVSWPTELVAIIYHLRIVMMGLGTCIASLFLKRMMFHASVLTILALSFERYYAICKPFRASTVCTNTRAAVICSSIWFFAALLTSPNLAIHTIDQQVNGTEIKICVSYLGDLGDKIYDLVTAAAFFFIPVIIIVVLYSLIVKNLVVNSALIDKNTKTTSNYVKAMRDRRQVVLMLVTVVISFFVCLLPRELIRVQSLIPEKVTELLGKDGVYKFKNISRITRLLHSAMNPIYYNLLSAKIRGEFAKLLRLNKLQCGKKSDKHLQRQDTVNTITSSVVYSSTSNLDS